MHGKITAMRIVVVWRTKQAGNNAAFGSCRLLSPFRMLPNKSKLRLFSAGSHGSRGTLLLPGPQAGGLSRVIVVRKDAR